MHLVQHLNTYQVSKILRVKEAAAIEATLNGILGRLAEAKEKSRKESEALAALKQRESDEIQLLQARLCQAQLSIVGKLL